MFEERNKRYGKYIVKRHPDGQTPTLALNQFAYTKKERDRKGFDSWLDEQRKTQLENMAKNPDMQDFEFIHREYKYDETIGQFSELAVFARKRHFEEVEEVSEKDRGKKLNPIGVSVTTKNLSSKS